MQLQRKKSFYEKYIKRVLDIICALLALVFTGWLFVIIAIVVRIKMGSPVLFKQPRPGMVDPKTGKEAIFDKETCTAAGSISFTDNRTWR